MLPNTYEEGSSEIQGLDNTEALHIITNELSGLHIQAQTPAPAGTKCDQQNEGVPILPGFNAMSTVLGNHEMLENLLKYTAPQELHKLRRVSTAFNEVIETSKVIKYITFREETVPRSLREEPEFLKYHAPPNGSEVQLHPFVDRLLRRIWNCALHLDPNDPLSAGDPLVSWYQLIPNNIYVTRPPVKSMSFMFNDPNNLHHVILPSPQSGVTLRDFIQTLGSPLIERCGNLIASSQRNSFPLPDICVSVRFKYPVSGPRNVNNQHEDHIADVQQYRDDYGAVYIAGNSNTRWY
ncbi:hypothetical protein TWF718_003432 [Orbilia javanica]|uniref:F-box domain-containing protein n=1 Tax=Orbilia javanica TaxID=47235 RepID=A0AAN8ML81_9PEZI